MITQDVELIEFLCARISDDEQATRAAITSFVDWVVDPESDGEDVFAISPNDPEPDRAVPYRNMSDDTLVACIDLDGGAADGTAEHIARWDPRRVLAEVDARRARVHLLCSITNPRQRRDKWPIDLDTETQRISALAHGLLRLEAAPYCTHPDYQDSWRLG